MSGDVYVIFFDFVVVTRTVHTHTAYFHNRSGKILVGCVNYVFGYEARYETWDEKP